MGRERIETSKMSIYTLFARENSPEFYLQISECVNEFKKHI